jgi:hypothetical protein
MSIILAFWLLLFPAPSDVENLRASAPAYLTIDAARDHLTAAQAAAVFYDLAPELLLAIAYRESRYTSLVRGPEVRGKHACGLMQPLMSTGRCPTQDLLWGYLEGAKHLRTWLATKTCRSDIRCAMLGYSGGYKLLKACAAGQVLVERTGRLRDICTIPEITFARARLIRGERNHSKPAV